MSLIWLFLAVAEPEATFVLRDRIPAAIEVIQRATRKNTAQGGLIARSILKYAAENDLTPEFLLAVATWESDLNPAAEAVHPLGNGQTAVDTGLMGIRCIFHGTPAPWRRCQNGPVRGLQLDQLREIDVNIRTGAHLLAAYRDQPVEIRVSGRRQRCLHQEHAYYAHYNWGHRLITTRPARWYDRNVAALTRDLMAFTGRATAPEINGVSFKSHAGQTRLRAFWNRLREASGVGKILSGSILESKPAH